MKKTSIVILIFFIFSCANAQQSSSDQEKAIQALKQSGILRQEGNTFIYKVQKASDTARVRLMYGNLFNNPQYNIRFDVDGKTFVTPKTNQIQTQVPVPKNANNNVKDPISTNTSISTGNCCMCNMKVFEYVGTYDASNVNSSPFREFIWVVPVSVNTIKIEGWSAGGDGWEGDTLGNQLGGGGGGGGAYILSTIKINAGDKITIRIPRGGANYPLNVNVSGTSVGTITVASGRNAQEAKGDNRYNGEGGRLLMNSGIFSSSIFTIKGNNGENGYCLVRQIASINFCDYYGGNGGSAPGLSTGGGKGSIYVVSDIIKATNGGYPGSGGGGGNAMYSLFNRDQLYRAGNGAGGMLIIYY